MTTTMNRVYIALGSNLAQPLQQVSAALEALRNLPQSHLRQCSPLYRTKPLGPQNQPDFLNAVVALDTLLAPEHLLDHTQNIERNQGRVRKDQRWGPRTLDLDILLYGNSVINSERLTVPHYGLKEREFMLYPLADLAPELVFPDGTALADCLKLIPKNGLMPWHYSSSLAESVILVQ